MRVLLLGLCILLAMSVSGMVLAQQPPSTPQTIFQTLSAEMPEIVTPYPLTANQQLQIEAFAITPGLAVAIEVQASDQTILQTTTNTSYTQLVTSVFTAPITDTYQIVIRAINGQSGDVAIYLRPYNPLAAFPLAEGTNDTGLLVPSSNISYSIRANPNETLALEVLAISEQGAARALVQNATGELVALLNPQSTGAIILLPPGSTRYTLTLRNPPGAAGFAYEVRLRVVVAQPDGFAVQLVPGLPTLPTIGNCIAATRQNTTQSIYNIDSSDTTIATILGSLDPAETYPVTGRNVLGTWLRIDYGNPNAFGWVSVEVVRRGGDCSTVPVTNP